MDLNVFNREVIQGLISNKCTEYPESLEFIDWIGLIT